MTDQNMPLFAEERKQEILRLLNDRRKLAVPELCDYFGVSASTIRNDMRDLERENLLTRTHGGAIAGSKTGHDKSPEYKVTRMIAQKQAIAAEAAERIEEGDRIAILTGTTTYELLRFLPGKKKLLVVLNDIGFASWLEQNSDCDILLLGGMLRRGYHYTFNAMYDDNLNRINIDKAFISCNGVSLERGVTSPDLRTASFIRNVMQASNENILLADSSKIGDVTFAQIAPLEDMDELITDNGIEEEDRKAFSSATNVTVVNVK